MIRSTSPTLTCTMRCKGAVFEGGINITTCALLYFVCVLMPPLPQVCGGLRTTFRSGTGFSPSFLLSHGLSCFCCTVDFKLAGPQALERPSCLLIFSEQECWDCRNAGSHASFWVAALVIRIGGKCISPLSVFLPSPACFSSRRTCFRVGEHKR